jgi:hypothetical protein
MEFLGFSHLKMVWNGIPRVFLFREMVRNGIPKLFSYSKQAEFRRNCRLFRLVPSCSVLRGIIFLSENGNPSYARAGTIALKPRCSKANSASLKVIGESDHIQGSDYCKLSWQCQFDPGSHLRAPVPGKRSSLTP